MSAAQNASKLAHDDRHLTVVRPGPRREQALSRARDARRKLDGRRQDGDRFAYLRRTHD